MAIQKLTKEQAVILMAFTGVAHGSFDAFHRGVEERLGRPVLSSEFADPLLVAQIKELYRNDFIELATLDPEERTLNILPVFNLDDERREYESLHASAELFERIDYVEVLCGYLPKPEYMESAIVMSIASQLTYGWHAWQVAREGMTQWVAVENKEPPLNTQVLIAWGDALDIEPEKDYMDVCVDTGNHYWANYEKDKPSHWMHVPKLKVKVSA